MDTIIHALEIDSPPEDVYRAVATADGLSNWWSTNVTADDKVGGIVDFTFQPGFNPDMKITALDEPKLVGWQCVDGHDPWQDATFRFEIEALDGGRSRLMFTMGYGKPISDVEYGIYNYNWGYYMHSLKQYVETGVGFPHHPG